MADAVDTYETAQRERGSQLQLALLGLTQQQVETNAKGQRDFDQAQAEAQAEQAGKVSQAHRDWKLAEKQAAWQQTVDEADAAAQQSASVDEALSQHQLQSALARVAWQAQSNQITENAAADLGSAGQAYALQMGLLQSGLQSTLTQIASDERQEVVSEQNTFQSALAKVPLPAARCSGSKLSSTRMRTRCRRSLAPA